MNLQRLHQNSSFLLPARLVFKHGGPDAPVPDGQKMDRGENVAKDRARVKAETQQKLKDAQKAFDYTPLIEEEEQDQRAGVRAETYRTEYQADKLVRAGKYKEALTLYDEVQKMRRTYGSYDESDEEHELYAEDPLIMYAKAKVALKAGKYEEAFREFDRFLDYENVAFTYAMENDALLIHDAENLLKIRDYVWDKREFTVAEVGQKEFEKRLAGVVRLVEETGFQVQKEQHDVGVSLVDFYGERANDPDYIDALVKLNRKRVEINHYFFIFYNPADVKDPAFQKGFEDLTKADIHPRQLSHFPAELVKNGTFISNLLELKKAGAFGPKTLDIYLFMAAIKHSENLLNRKYVDGLKKLAAAGIIFDGHLIMHGLPTLEKVLDDIYVANMMRIKNALHGIDRDRYISLRGFELSLVEGKSEAYVPTYIQNRGNKKQTDKSICTALLLFTGLEPADATNILDVDHGDHQNAVAIITGLLGRNYLADIHKEVLKTYLSAHQKALGE